MRNATLGLLAAALLALSFAVRPSGRGRSDAVSPGGTPLVQVRKDEFRQTVRVYGSLRPEKLTRITSELSDLAITRVIAEGSQVRRDDVLVELDRAGLDEEILTARENVATAEAELSATQAAFERARAEIEAEVRELEARQAVAEARLALEQSRPLPEQLTVAQAQLSWALAACEHAAYWLEATQALFEEGIVGHRDLRTAELAHYSASLDRQQAETVMAEMAKGADSADLESAEAQLAEARLSFEQAAESKEQRISQAESAVKSAENALAGARRKLSQLEEDLRKTRIRAPHDGTAFAPSGGKLAVGDSAWQGKTLVELADATSLILQGRVREADSRLVKVGHLAQLDLRAFPGVPVSGIVTKVGDALSEDEEHPDVRHLDIDIKLEQMPAGARPRMTGHADVVVTRIPNALVLPRSCVRDGVVTVVENGRLRQRKVEVQAADSTFVALRSGLREGDLVCLCPAE